MKHRPNTLRIIGGNWRGRRVSFPDVDGLRPTGDRIRETVFNWLQAYTPGARCLDLFSGSGAMGLEALSRGAESVVFVERNAAAAAATRTALATFGVDNGQVLQADALRFLETPTGSFDIVFIDPPFGADIISKCCELLEQHHWLKPGALIYMEQDRAKAVPSIPDNWTMHRQAHAGQVAYYLARRHEEAI
ncbi:MAG TPA: 16S rRNA (guanine(966)-N(2))-methyltransferase RsmD [Gammaproteobacteria bacterium]|nr:16S rRNA (guanine(966)-N(2))-methyltransferase RsmD [Gammaproteobacteria bacterium]